VLVVVLVIYFSGRSAGKSKGEKEKAELEKKYLEVKEGDEIPPGYNAEVDARALKTAGEWNFSTGGTDEDTIFNILENRTQGQLKLINNEFVSLFEMSLFEFLQYELDSDELARAMAPLRYII